MCSHQPVTFNDAEKEYNSSKNRFPDKLPSELALYIMQCVVTVSLSQSTVVLCMDVVLPVLIYIFIPLLALKMCMSNQNLDHKHGKLIFPNSSCHYFVVCFQFESQYLKNCKRYKTFQKSRVRRPNV